MQIAQNNYIVLKTGQVELLGIIVGRKLIVINYGSLDNLC